ncbi:MAG: tetraacyldisaccharide 4'-kinase [Bacteroidaceae bacterium]|nr:tetraacyldisaccharide 4'-kinase [Bacteroidaceae bacterium]
MGIEALALPISWLYGMVTGLRNLLYDSGVLPSRSYDIPVISVGNISVGGTGKTPHTEYLIRLLRATHHVCVLSRGYKRKSHGFQLASPHSTVSDIGDEPMQMHRKFPDVRIAVDADRCHGIDTLIEMRKAERRNDAMVVLLDDAFQHRRVRPGLSILLTDYHRPIYRDHLMPAGRLRETPANYKRADIIIVTKCPEDLSLTEQSAIEQQIQPQNWQKLFFSTFCYSGLPENSQVLLVTGIANPLPLETKLQDLGNDVITLRFGDHHDYTIQDIDTIRRRSEKRTVVTTEKDAVKLKEFVSADIHFVVASIEVRFLNNQQEEFNNTINDYANS